eukprot:jgi/Bigna1/91597/estExt_fgenesh1_pg.C_1080029
MAEMARAHQHSDRGHHVHGGVSAVWPRHPRSRSCRSMRTSTRAARCAAHMRMEVLRTSGIFEKLRESSRSFENIPEDSRIFQNLREHSGSFENLPENSREFWKIRESSRMRRNPMRTCMQRKSQASSVQVVSQETQVDVVDQRCSPVPGDCVTRTLLCTSHAALWSHADVLTFIQRFRDEFGDRLTHPSAAWLHLYLRFNMADEKSTAKDDDAGLPPQLRMFAENTDQPFELETFLENFMKKPESIVDPQVALKGLRNELRGAKISLQNRLIDLLNSNYRDFIGLPTMLTGTSDSVDGTSRELSSVHSQMEHVYKLIQTVVKRFENASERQKAVARKKKVLLILKDAVETFDKVKRLLDVAENPFSSSSLSSSSSSSPAAAAAAVTGESATNSVFSKGEQTVATEAKTKFENEGKMVMRNAGIVKGAGEREKGGATLVENYHQMLSEKILRRKSTTKDFLFEKNNNGGSRKSGEEGDDDDGAVDQQQHQQQRLFFIRRVSAFLERISREITRLKVDTERTKRFKISKDIQSVIPELEERMLKLLKRTFVDVMILQQEDIILVPQEVIAQCLRCFISLDKIELAESTLREHVVKPIIKTAITKDIIKALLQEDAAATGEQKQQQHHHQQHFHFEDACTLQHLFQMVISSVSSRCQSVLDATLFPLTAFSFVTKSIAAEILPALEDAGGSEFFAPYLPDRFFGRYSACQQLLKALQDLCPDRVRKQRLMTSRLIGHFQSKWSLSVYFQLRFQDIRKGLEAAVTHKPQKRRAAAATATATATALGEKKDAQQQRSEVFFFTMTASHQVYKAVFRCWEKGIFIEKLTHRFFKATIQLLRRYIFPFSSSPLLK